MQRSVGVTQRSLRYNVTNAIKSPSAKIGVMIRLRSPQLGLSEFWGTLLRHSRNDTFSA